MMRSIFKPKTHSILALGSLAGAIALVSGCGGGGGGGGDNNNSTPTPFDDTYTATYVPTDTLASDAKAPTGTLVVNRGRANTTFTYFLRPAVINRYQPQIDKALRDNGVAGDIRNNQIPTSFEFTAAKSLDGSGKVTLVSNKSVPVCGKVSLTLDANFEEIGGAVGTYKVDVPDHFTVRIRGANRELGTDVGSCLGLPNRAGSATFSRPVPTATPITPAPAG